MKLDAELFGKEFKGFIINIPKTKFLVFHGRHWLTIKKINGVWYNLDAKLKQPRIFKSDNALQAYLKYELTKNQAELMIVRQDVNQYGQSLKT